MFPSHVQNTGPSTTIMKRYFRAILSSALPAMILALTLVAGSEIRAQQLSAAQARQQPAALNSAQLHEAARTGNTALLRSQLNQGISPDATDASGRTALAVAAQNGRVEAVRVLLDGGAHIDARSLNGSTALIQAAEAGQTETSKLLIERGADVNASTRLGSALEIAERTGQRDLAVMLRRAGARTSGRSVGDKVCVRPWQGDGYCGVVEDIHKNQYQLRVTEIIGCKDGCPARSNCSENRPVGGQNGISIGDQVSTDSSCLTQTGVK